MSLINCGWLNIYKPLNITSSNTVSKIKKKFKLKKVGHAGTLDPKAEGILPVAFGNATKIISFVTNKSKKYYFIIKWGEQTSTDDSEGSLIYKSRKIPNINEINNNLSKYSGDIYQVPPKYSAIKVNGIRAYQLSRNKNEFKLLPRKVKIYSIEYIKNISFNKSAFSITCGKGFYIRSFARDFAISLGSRGHIVALKRQEVGIFKEKNSILLDDLLKISHLSEGIKGFYHSSVVLDDIPALTVNNSEKTDIRMGKKIYISFINENFLKKLNQSEVVCAKNNEELIALGYLHDGFFKPTKVFN